MPTSSATSSPSTSCSVPPKSLLLPPIKFPLLSQNISADSSSYTQLIKQPIHQISPDFILGNSSDTPFSSTNITNNLSAQLLSATTEYRFEPFKLSTTSSPYVPSFMSSSSFLSAPIESKPPGFFISHSSLPASDGSSSLANFSHSNNIEQSKQKPVITSSSPILSSEAISQSKGPITILKRTTANVNTSAIEDLTPKASKAVFIKPASEIEPLIKEVNSISSKVGSTKKIPASVETSKSNLEDELTKKICASIEKTLYPRIEASINSLLEDISKFQVSCTKKYNDAIENLTFKFNSCLTEACARLENSSSNIETSLANLVLSSNSNLTLQANSDLISKSISAGNYNLALKDVLGLNDSTRLFSVLDQIPPDNPKVLEDLSLSDIFKCIFIFKDIIDQGTSSPYFIITLFWFYEILVKFESFIETISPYRSPTSSISSLNLIENEDIMKLRSEVQGVLDEISKENEYGNNLVALFESLSTSFQRSVIPHLHDIVASSSDKVPLSERKLRLTNRMILSLQVELDKLLNDDY